MNISSPKNAVATRFLRPLMLRNAKGSRLVLRALLLFVVAVCITLVASIAPHAQRTQERPVRLTGVTSHKTSDGRTIYTIKADGPLNRAQTWQDGSGQHIVLYKGTTGVRGQLPPGVRIGQVSNSLEVVLPANERQRIVVHPRLNQIDVVVSGGTGEAVAASGAREAGTERNGVEPKTARQRARDAARDAARQRSNNVATGTKSETRSFAPIANKSFSSQQPFSSQQFPRNSVVSNAGVGIATNTALPAANTVSAGQPSAGQPSAGQPKETVAAVTPPLVATSSPTPNATPANVSAAVSAPAVPEEGGSSYFYHLGIIGGTMMCGALALVFARRRRQADEIKKVEEFFGDGEKTPEATGNGKATASTKVVNGKEKTKEEKSKADKAKGTDKSPVEEASNRRDEQALVKSDIGAASPALKFQSPAAAAPVVIFGAFQVDQEVGKLVRGEAHRLDVLCSRAADDRRAIETSLMKALQNQHSTDAVRRKARQALEDYGFVARSCAALLLTPEGHDRVAAARTLSVIASPTALGFLIEALYDREATVRTEAIAGLGALRLPSAIGALLDVARRHSDISPALLSRALTACSVEALDFGAGGGAGEFGVSFDGEAWTGEIVKLEPVETMMALPEWLEDETLADAFGRLDSTDVEARAAAARQLAQFPVQRGVDSLAHMAANDSEPAVRAAAVTSLGVVDHESVFAHVLLRLVDDAREVRAAAARALSRLSFDRADAYVRVIEAETQATLAGVAAAVTGAGMASQAIDRLVSEDRRQAYEAFSLLSVLVKTGKVEPLLESVAEHRNIDVRLALIRFLGLTGGAHYIEQLNEIAERKNTPATVRTAIREAAAKIAQAQEVCEAK